MFANGGASIYPKGPKRTQKDPKGTQKDPKGTQKDPKGTQKDPEGTQKESKSNPKGHIEGKMYQLVSILFLYENCIG
jgi:hypothetical protein